MARRHGPFATLNSWRVIGVSVAVGLSLGTALVGFVVLPFANRHTDEPFWTAICTAVGLQSRVSYHQPAPPPRYASSMQWSAREVAAVNSGDIGRGGQIAQSCSACHGDAGVSAQTWLPSLAGLPPDALVKQLTDFQTGHRSWPVMNAIAGALTRQDMNDVAAHYASLPAKSGPKYEETFSQRGPLSSVTIVHLATVGDAVRGVAPCVSCHGQEGRKRAAPFLTGQNAAYLARQLEAFRNRTRANDEGEQMRVIASTLSDDEIAGLADVLSRYTR